MMMVQLLQRHECSDERTGFGAPVAGAPAAGESTDTTGYRECQRNAYKLQGGF